ncbi:hypothetical protein ACFQY4_31350 [Catellatospora bangladeshensis]|uniref:WXG100 family type VII secretion target n=1 Tax=Catellatospora bangladeshensis TaxID=310355 RepID=A0A8J3JI77_9ACTN|nr:hypothetical protein [Catellatospora bangladeshensis]GIF85161.1 hypothetical protein Cba03nite_65100 [Catellatospora bangladeshensis]
MTAPGPQIDLDAPAARDAARRLHAAGDAMARERGLSGARIEQGGARRPWGGDELGRAFAKEYEDGAALLLRLWGDAAHRTAGLAVDVATAVDRVQGVDQQSEARLRSAERTVSL